jgi:hypothetical protein
MKPGNLLLKKLLLAFLLGAVPAFLTGLTAIVSGEAEVDFTSWQAVGLAILSVISGGVAVGLRAALAQWTSWMPTDELHGSGSTPERVVVTPES